MDYFTEQDIAKKLQLAKTMVGASTTQARGFGHGGDAGILLGNWLDIIAREFIFTDVTVHYGRDVTDVIAANKKFTMDKSGSAKDCARVWAQARYTKTKTWDQQQEQWTWNAVMALLEQFIVFLKFVTLIRGLDEPLKQAVRMKRGESEIWTAAAEWIDVFGPLHGEKLAHALRSLCRGEDVNQWNSRTVLFEAGTKLIMEIRKVGKKALAEVDHMPRAHPLYGHQRRY